MSPDEGLLKPKRNNVDFHINFFFFLPWITLFFNISLYMIGLFSIIYFHII